MPNRKLCIALSSVVIPESLLAVVIARFHAICGCILAICLGAIFERLDSRLLFDGERVAVVGLKNLARAGAMLARFVVHAVEISLAFVVAPVLVPVLGRDRAE